MTQKRVVVIGGGISGLAAAHRLLELDPTLEVTLLEASSRLGGVLDTARRDGFLIERSADNFITSPGWAVDLCRRIGLEGQLLATSSDERNAMVVHDGRLVKIPPGFMLMAPARLWPLVTTPILSVAGKLRLLAEYFVRRRPDGADETLGDFARRRLGREAFERIVQPLVGGIYTADPEKLSLKATLPRFIDMERQYGGLIRGAKRQARPDGAANAESGARYGMFVAPREGLTSLVEAIAARLPQGCVQLDSPVDNLSRSASGQWQIDLKQRGRESLSADCVKQRLPSPLFCDAVIVAVPAERAARVLADADRDLASDLSRIPYAGTAIVSLAFRREQIARPLDSFGFVVPAVEKRKILAGSFASVKFAGRAPEDAVLIRVFIGGACQSELLELSDDELQTIASDELGALLGTSGRPLLSDVARWPHSMPQYHVGHCELVAGIERAADRLPHFALAGNAYHGVGIPNCIHSGELAAERICAQLNAGVAQRPAPL